MDQAILQLLVVLCLCASLHGAAVKKAHLQDTKKAFTSPKLSPTLLPPKLLPPTPQNPPYLESNHFRQPPTPLQMTPSTPLPPLAPPGESLTPLLNIREVLRLGRGMGEVDPAYKFTHSILFGAGDRLNGF